MPLPLCASSDPFERLQHAVALCLQLPNTRPMTRIQALQDAAETIKRSRSSPLRVLNDTAPVNRLPDDLLSRMLSYARLDDRPSAGQVCHRWRVILADLDQCWDETELWFSDRDQFVRAGAVLTRFASTPVPVSFTISQDCIGLMGILRLHLFHITRLSISLMPELGLLADDPQACQFLVLTLETPAIILIDLELWRLNGFWDTSDYAYLSDNLLSGVAPRLRSLSLHGFKLRDSLYPALLGLRTLCLSQPEVNLAHIVAFYPQLEQLRIEAKSLAGSDQNCSPHRLELLQVPGTLDVVEKVCTQLDIARPLTIWTETGNERLLGYLLENLPRQEARRVQLLFLDVLTRDACVIKYSSGLTWVVGNWPPISYLAICDAEVMASVTQLSIHELAWPRMPQELPSAPSFTSLEIVLYRFTLPSGNGHGHNLVGIFSDDDESLCTLQCPELETLSLLSPTRPALAVDVFDVLGLIDRRLRFAEGLLPCLTLRNVSLYDPALGRGMALLTARVQRIDYCEFTGQDVPYVHQKHTSLSWVYSMMDRVIP